MSKTRDLRLFKFERADAKALIPLSVTTYFPPLKSKVKLSREVVWDKNSEICSKPLSVI